MPTKISPAGLPRGALRVGAGVLCTIAGAGLILQAIAIRSDGVAWQSAQAQVYEEETPPPAFPRTRGDARQDPAPVPEGQERGPRAAGPGTYPGPSSPPVAAPKRGDAIARLRIPRLGIDAVVAEGTDAATLKLGPGHLIGSGFPGEADNCIIAGHRDSHFGRLRGIREGDTVELSSADGGVLRYAVASIRVVDEDNTADLAPARRPILTLITCYPFNYVGPAPQRLVVRGELVGEPVLTAGRGARGRTGNPGEVESGANEGVPPARRMPTAASPAATGRTNCSNR